VTAISCTTTAYGQAALEALTTTVDRHKNGNSLAPVTVIVPNNYVGVATRRALGRRGLAATTFLTTYRLAELLASARVSASGRRPVSTPVLAGAVRAVLRADAGHFEGVETHPSTERALVRAHRELSEVDDAGLRRLATTSTRAADVVRIHRQVAERLRPSFSNEQDLARAAVDAMAGSSPALTGLGPVIVYLPQRLTSTQIRLLTAVRAQVPVEVMVGLTGDPAADSTVIAAVARLTVSPEPPLQIVRRAPTRALSVSDADDEVRHAVREVIAAARAGVHLSRCAVLYGTAEPYARLVADALDAADVPWFGASVRTAESSLLGRSLLALLALGDHDLSRRDVAAWLSGAPIRGTDNRLAPVAAWERISRQAGIMSGPDQWRQRLERLAGDLEAEAGALERDDEQAWRAELNRRDAGRARDLAGFIERLRRDLDPGPRGRRWSGLASWCRGLLRSYIGGENLRRRWPDDERRAADRIEAAIDRLGDLDDIDPDPSVAAFRRALTLELENDLGRHGSFGSGVMVGPVGLAVGIELDRVMFLGLAEGTFPARRRDDALLPDRERRVVGPDLPLRAARADDDHHALLAVLATASESMMLFPRGDLRRGAVRAPSRWLLDAVEIRDGVRSSTETLATDTGDWFDEVPSFVAGLRRSDFPAHAQEYDVRALLDQHDAGIDPTNHPLLSHRPEVSRGMDLVVGRASSSFTRFDGNVNTDGDLRLTAPTDPEVVVSATKLETWAGCPHAYFVRYVLGVDALHTPEHEYRITPLVKGALVHRALDRWLGEAIDSDAVPQPDERWPDAWRHRLLEIGGEECERIQARGLSGRPLYWQRDRKRILADLDDTVTFDDEQRRDGTTVPIATELDFGMPGSPHDPVVVRLTDGRTIRIRGSIDRVDHGFDDQLVIIDYKTGQSHRFKGLSTEDPAPGGGHLQLVLYAAAARSILGRTESKARGAYWFVSQVGKFAAHGYEITPAVEGVVLGLVGAVSDGIAAGLFPLHPAQPGWRNRVPCWFCEPDGLGTRDQWRDWERKHDDPRLRPYLDIAEPDLLHHVGSTNG
jgi:hypothetical protein